MNEKINLDDLQKPSTINSGKQIIPLPKETFDFKTP